MKIVCPRCGGLARVVYIQNTGAGRAWIRLADYLWCKSEAAIVRVSDKRSSPAPPVQDANLQNAVITHLSALAEGATLEALYRATGAASRSPPYLRDAFRDFLDGMVVRNLLLLEKGRYSTLPSAEPP